MSQSNTSGIESDLASRLYPAVRQVMQVQDVTAGGSAEGYLARFRGRLLINSDQAYSRLAPVFSAEDMLLLFRAEGDEQVILAVPGHTQPRRSNPWVNVVLFGLTLVSVVVAGAIYAYRGPATGPTAAILQGLLRAIPEGAPFAGGLLTILLAHEFGHYLAARFHSTAVSLPYFLPFPGSTFGTMGAFIQLKEPPKNRRVLLDIGLAGPLAGFVVALPILLLGLALSEIGSLPATLGQAQGQGLEGNSVLYLAAKYLVTGELLPAPVSYGDVHPVLYWIRYLLVGLPIPLAARDVLLHPLAWAGWAGLLVTALNLIPAGQLDGGHVLYVLAGRKAVRLVPFIVVGLALLGLVWYGWWLWAGLIFLLGRTHAQPLDDLTPLDPRRRVLAILGLILFVLVFTPVPLRILGGAT
jgi:membrane-associated protease RseP (regulator of RpoE activity)